MRAYKTLHFAMSANLCGLSDGKLSECIREFEKGLIGDSLGGNLYKKRVSIPQGGKRGGLRVIVIYKESPERIFCLDVFSKRKKSNLSQSELLYLRSIGKTTLQFTDKEIENAIDAGFLEEFSYHDDEKNDA